jgi:nucleosome binding factor SPN SPT16 subunit
MHCTNRNKLGRYFPVSIKNLTDNTANSLQTHISSCSRCPEHVKASLAYLGHRSVLQKAELSGFWKKAFFKKVWERLHIERAWTSVDDEDKDDVEVEDYSSNGEHQQDEEEDEVEDTKEDDDEGEESESEKEEMGEQMNALIKAAAIWLTEQDGPTTDSSKQGARASRERSLPAKRSTFTAPRSRAGANLPTKRRRVHF